MENPAKDSPTPIVAPDDEATKELAPVSVELSFEPEKDVERATRAANALVNIIKNNQAEVSVNIQGNRYLKFEAWQMIAAFFKSSVRIAWTKPVTDADGKQIGWEARAEVVRAGSDEPISSAEASCLTSEKSWAQREDFHRRSMAQTRASAKALRMAYSYVVVLAGYKPTPAEEMDGIEELKHDEPARQNVAAHAGGVSPKQMNYMIVLAKERGMESWTPLKQFLTAFHNMSDLPEKVTELNGAMASAIIKTLMEIPKKETTQSSAVADDDIPVINEDEPTPTTPTTAKPVPEF